MITVRSRFRFAPFIVSALLLSLHDVKAEDLKDIRCEVIPEGGSPIAIVSGKTQLEIDSFGAPIACRIYIDYKNGSEKPLSAVKFRIGYVDPEGKLRGFFHAPVSQGVSPGALSSHKWRGDKVDPRTSQVKVRVLTARFADGTIWESEKMKELNESGRHKIARPDGEAPPEAAGEGAGAGESVQAVPPQATPPEPSAAGGSANPSTGY